MAQPTQNTNPKFFFINRSEISERFDPLCFKTINSLSIVKKTIYEVKKLSEVVIMQRGRFGHRPRNDPKFYDGKYPFIQTGDVVRASLTGEKILFSQTLNELGLRTSRLFEPYKMIITIAANIGDTAILDYPACFPDSLIAISPKDENQLTVFYLNIYFKFLKNYLNDIAPQAAQKNINYQQLAPTPIIIPPINIQHEIVEKINNAYTLKLQKEAQAQELLKSIDTYLLNELGITLPEKNNSLENRMFTVNFSEIVGSRLDSNFNSEYYKEIFLAFQKSKYPFVKINNVLKSIKTGTTPNEKLDAFTNNEELVFLRNTNLKKYHIDLNDVKYVKNEFKNELTFSEKNEVIMCIAGTVGLSAINNYELPIAINQNVSSLKFNEKIMPEFASFWFNTELFIDLTKRACSMATIFYLNNDNLKSLPIPLPPISEQQKIINHINDIQNQIKTLQTEAKQLLEEAKQEVEKMIIG